MDLKTSEPFWLVKNGIINSYPSLREDIETDILIIGSGITGSLIAHQCIADGYDTVVIDKREVAQGSTSATTSMLQYEIDVPLYKLSEMIGKNGATESYRACYRSIDDLENISQEISSECGFKKKESLYFAVSRKDEMELKKEFSARKEAGFPVLWIEQKEIEQKYQMYNTYGGILSRQGGSIDAFRLAHDLLAYNHKRGLKIFDKTALNKVRYGKNEVKVETNYGNIISAKRLIYCTGFETTEIIKENFVNLISTFAIVGEVSKSDIAQLTDTLFWNTANPYMYMRTTDDNRLLIGGEDEKFSNATRRDAILHKKAKALENYLKRILPKNEFRTDFAWAGTFGSTADGLPYIGRHPKFPNSLFVLGFGGNGITFSVIGMGMISKMLKGEPHPLEEYFKFKR